MCGEGWVHVDLPVASTSAQTSILTSSDGTLLWFEGILWVALFPPKRYVKVPTSRTSKCDLYLGMGLLQVKLVKMRWYTVEKKEESEVVQSCRTLCNPMDCRPPGSSVHGISQARILEWVATSFSRGTSWPRDWTQVSRIAGRHFTLWATREAIRSREGPYSNMTGVLIRKGKFGHTGRRLSCEDGGRD